MIEQTQYYTDDQIEALEDQYISWAESGKSSNTSAAHGSVYSS